MVYGRHSRRPAASTPSRGLAGRISGALGIRWSAILEGKIIVQHRLSFRIICLRLSLSCLSVRTQIDVDRCEEEGLLARIRKDRGYTYQDTVDVCPAKLPNYEQKVQPCAQTIRYMFLSAPYKIDIISAYNWTVCDVIFELLTSV